MAFADIQAKTTVTGFSAGDKATILATLQTAYDGSKIAQAMFDGWIATAGHTIDIAFVAGKFQALTVGGAGTGKLQIDMSYLTNASYINSTGKAVKDTAVTAIVHELGHALTGKPDDWTMTEYKGSNVKFVNTIYKELGLDEQLSYIAYDGAGTRQKIDFQYTNGATIDAAFSSNSDWTTAALGSSRDLLIGGASGNTLQGSDGSDWLCGNGGDDVLDGGAGTDTAVYMSTPLDYDIRQNADGTWAVRDVRGAKTEGSDTLRNVEKIQFSDGSTYDLAKHALSFQTDFALVIDTTGSMGSSISSVKAQASSLIDAAFAAGKADARIGVVSFKDTTNGEPSSVILPFTDQDDFATRKSTAITAINGIGVSGGGDIPETAFDGLRMALDGTMGKWRAGAGVLRIALFTDAPAKDGALAAQVTALAHAIGGTASSRSSMVGLGGAVDTFDFTVPTDALATLGRDGSSDPGATPTPTPTLSASPLTPDSTTNQVQIFTINTGAASTDMTALTSIAKANGGSLLTAPTDADLVKQLMAIISAPPVPTYAISATDASKAEGNAGTTAFTFTVSRSGDTSAATSLNYAVTGSGTSPAVAGDFTGGALPSGTVDFAAGATSATITINVAGDTVVEPDKSFTVTLTSAASDAVLSNSTATGTILNDDVVGATTYVIAASEANKVTGTSGTTAYKFVVKRTGDVSGAATLNYSVKGTGTNPAAASMFANATGTVSFAAGAATAVVAVNVNGATVSASQTFTVTISDPGGATVSTPTAGGTIQPTPAANQATVMGAGGVGVTLTFATAALASQAQVQLNGVSTAVGAGTLVAAATSAGGLPTVASGSAGFAQIDSGGLFTIPAGYTTAVNVSAAPVSLISAAGGGKLIVSSGTGSMLYSAVSGTETVYAGVGTSLMFGNSASMNIIGGLGAASIVGGTGTNTITGGSGTMLLFGTSKTTYTGGAGAATIVGGTGGLTANMGAGGGVVFGTPGGGNALASGTGDATLVGGGAGDVVVSTGAGKNALIAGAGAETLNASGATAANVFFGGTGADSMVGGSGNDLFLAGTANETLTGGAGNNTYVFNAVSGGTTRVDIFTDFDTNRNGIFLFGYGSASSANAAALATQKVVGGVTQIVLSDGTQLNFLGAPTLKSFNFFT